MSPAARRSLRPGQAWQRAHALAHSWWFGDPVMLVKKAPGRGGKHWLVLDLSTGATRSERFSARDSWRRVV